MKIPRTRLWLYIALLMMALVIMALLARSLASSSTAVGAIERDYIQIIEDGKLRLLLPYNEDEIAEEQTPQTLREVYRLATQLSRTKGLEVELIHQADYTQALELLLEGEVDAIAGGYIHNSTQDTTHILPVALRQAKPLYLVQRSGRDALGELLELEGCTIHLPASRAWGIYVTHLAEELSVPIHVAQMENADVAQLMKAVSSGKIDYTIATQEEAQYYIPSMDSLEARLPLTLSLRQGWLVRRTSPMLRDSLEHWLFTLPH